MFVSFLLMVIVFLTSMTIKQKIIFKKEYEKNETEINRLKELVADYKEISLDRDIQISNLQKDIDALKDNKAKYIGQFKISYYCACEKCCGKTDGITASGVKVQEGVTIAADTSILPFGTKVFIQGVGNRIVQDRGSSIKGNKIDVYVTSHNSIPKVGVHNSDVWMVIE